MVCIEYGERVEEGLRIPKPPLSQSLHRFLFGSPYLYPWSLFPPMKPDKYLHDLSYFLLIPLPGLHSLYDHGCCLWFAS